MHQLLAKKLEKNNVRFREYLEKFDFWLILAIFYPFSPIDLSRNFKLAQCVVGVVVTASISVKWSIEYQGQKMNCTRYSMHKIIIYVPE